MLSEKVVTSSGVSDSVVVRQPGRQGTGEQDGAEMTSSIWSNPNETV